MLQMNKSLFCWRREMMSFFTFSHFVLEFWRGFEWMKDTSCCQLDRWKKDELARDINLSLELFTFFGNLCRDRVLNLLKPPSQHSFPPEETGACCHRRIKKSELMRVAFKKESRRWICRKEVSDSSRARVFFYCESHHLNHRFLLFFFFLSPSLSKLRNDFSSSSVETHAHILHTYMLSSSPFTTSSNPPPCKQDDDKIIFSFEFIFSGRSFASV